MSNGRPVFIPQDKISHVLDLHGLQLHGASMPTVAKVTAESSAKKQSPTVDVIITAIALKGVDFIDKVLLKKSITTKEGTTGYLIYVEDFPVLLTKEALLQLKEAITAAMAAAAAEAEDVEKSLTLRGASFTDYAIAGTNTLLAGAAVVAITAVAVAGGIGFLKGVFGLGKKVLGLKSKASLMSFSDRPIQVYNGQEGWWVMYQGRPIFITKDKLAHSFDGDVQSLEMDNVRIIKHVGSQWCVFTADGEKQLGCHPTKEAALKQLAAIEVSKAAAAGRDIVLTVSTG